MKEQNKWVFYKDINFNDPKFNVFSVDTRDFHMGYRLEKKSHKDISTLNKYKHFFFTEEELIKLLDRFYSDSGGNNEDWRFFELEGYGGDWSLKYLRIWREEKGFIVCNKDNQALRKDILRKNVLNRW